MRLLGYIEENRDSIIEKWYECLIMSYPPEAQMLFKNRNNKFANPMVYTFSTELSNIFEYIFFSDDTAALEKCVDAIIKIRAVQALKPSQAAGFVNSLRNILINELIDFIENKEDLFQFVELNNKINKASNLAFDLYFHEKERLMEIKSHEKINRYAKMLERLEQKYDL